MNEYWDVEMNLHTFLTLTPDGSVVISFMLWLPYTWGNSPWYPVTGG